MKAIVDIILVCTYFRERISMTQVEHRIGVLLLNGLSKNTLVSLKQKVFKWVSLTSLVSELQNTPQVI